MLGGWRIIDALHSRTMDHATVALGFDLLMLDGDDLRRQPLVERKAALAKTSCSARAAAFSTSNMLEGARR